MLSLAEPSAPEVLTDTLADVAAVLHPDAGMGPPELVLMSARGALLRFLRRFRSHFHEHAVLWAALREAEPSAFEPLGRIPAEHRELRRLAQHLCDEIREGRVAGAHRAARTLLAVLLGHVVHERVLFVEAVRSLGPAATSRYADHLFNRMLHQMGDRERTRLPRESVADLHSLYVRLIRHLQGRPERPRPAEASHEHPCRR